MILNAVTIASKWEDFAKHAIPVGCSDLERISIERCFFAGAFAFLNATMAIKNMPREMQRDMCAALQEELLDYWNDKSEDAMAVL